MSRTGTSVRTDGIDYRIIGDDMQLVEVELDPSEGVRAEAGTMIYMADGIRMQTDTGGGIFKGFKRMVSGESFFITTFVHDGTGKSQVAFAAPYPGKIVPIDLDKKGGAFLCQKDAFLCADASVEIEVAFSKRLGAGLFGGEGFILQRLVGSGWTFVHAGGTVVERELREGQTLRVDTGCIAAFSESVDYDIEFVGGFKNALFGGEGLFLATLSGPGTVYLQSLPFARLADRIVAGEFANRGESTGPGGSGILGDLISGD
jgi:uncharacterized protein (TIGR00266 family)